MRAEQQFFLCEAPTFYLGSIQNTCGLPWGLPLLAQEWANIFPLSLPCANVYTYGGFSLDCREEGRRSACKQTTSSQMLPAWNQI